MDLEAPEEAHSQHDYDSSMAPQFRAAGGRIYGLSRASFLELHQRHRLAAGAECLGRTAAVQHRLW